MNKNLREERIGTKGINTYGSEMEIVEYNNKNDMWVKFLKNGNLVHNAYNNFIKGLIKNPYDKDVYGIGCIGEGKYKTKENGKQTSQYLKWTHMLMRCYDKKSQETNPTYVNCDVAEEWLNFQNFATWCNNQEFFNAKDNQGNSYQLDKDILVKGNKVYSPETCCFVPQEINNLVSCKTYKSGKTGVFYREKCKKFSAQVKLGKQGYKSLGSFETESEAFQAYKKAKESYVKQVAEKWRDAIFEKSYKSLLKWRCL